MESKDAIAALSALAQPTRLEVFRMLVRSAPGGLPAGEIARALALRPNTLSTHLGILSRAGLVAASREGRSIRYAVAHARMGELLAFLLEDCCAGRPEICSPLLALTAACPRSPVPPERSEDDDVSARPPDR